MKRAIIFLWGLMLLAGCGEKQPNVLKMVTEPTCPPYEFLRGSEIIGVDVNICRAVAEKLGYGFSVTAVEFDAILPSLISGKANLAAAGLTITEDRRKNVDFSVPYLKTGLVIISWKAKPVLSLDAIKDARVGVQGGTTGDEYCVQTLKCEPERFRTYPEAVAALKAGRCDLVLCDQVLAQNCISGEEDLVLSPLVTTEEYAIAVPKNNPKLLAAVNETISELKANGKLAAWVAFYTAKAYKIKDDDLNTLKMITEATFPPYEFLRGQEIVGIDVEICRAVAEKLGKSFQAETVDFDSVIPAVLSGKADLAAAGITITEDRKKNVDFSIPYVKTGIVVISKKSNPFKDISQLKGRKIGVQAGTTSETYVLEQLQQEPERSRSPAEAVAGLRAGRCEFVIADIDPAKNCVKGEADLQLSDFITSEEYAIAIRKGQPELLAAINKTITELKANGELEKWIAAYTDESNKLKDEQTVYQSFVNDFYLCFIKNGRYDYLIHGLAVTIEVAFYAILLGLAVGFLVATIRSTHDKYGKFAILNALAKVYLTVIRGTPMVVQLLITYYIILRNIDSKVLIAILAFGINSGAYQAEIIRAGIASIDAGQMEAGRALGLSYWRTMLRIVLPQAIRNVLPALGNEFIVLMKDTSIVGYISLIDLAKGGDIIRSQTYSVYLPYLTVAAIYLVLVMAFTMLLGKLERYLRKTGAEVVHRDS